MCGPGLWGHCSVLETGKELRVSQSPFGICFLCLSTQGVGGGGFTHRLAMQEHRGQEERALGRRENHSVQSSKGEEVMEEKAVAGREGKAQVLLMQGRT